MDEDFYEPVFDDGQWKTKQGRLLQDSSEGKIETEIEPPETMLTCPYETSGTYLEVLKTNLFVSGDYEFKYTVRVEKSKQEGSVGAIFRIQSRKTFYKFEWTMEHNCAMLWHVDNLDHTIIASATTANAFTRNALHEFKIVTSGNSIKIDIDGTEVLDATDNSFASGAIGLYTSNSDSTWFDDLRLVVNDHKDQLAGYDPPPTTIGCTTLRDFECHWDNFDKESSDRVIANDNSDNDYLVVADGPPDKWTKELPVWEIDESKDRVRSRTTSGFVGSSPCIDSYGTFLYLKRTAKMYKPEKLIATQMSNQRSESMGVMFNVQKPLRGTRDTWSYYRVDWNQADGCLSLVRYRDGRMQLLDKISDTFTQDRTYDLEIWVYKTGILVEVDGEVVLSAGPPDITHGAVALYCRSSLCNFENVREKKEMDLAVEI